MACMTLLKGFADDVPAGRPKPPCKRTPGGLRKPPQCGCSLRAWLAGPGVGVSETKESSATATSSVTRFLLEARGQLTVTVGSHTCLCRDPLRLSDVIGPGAFCTGDLCACYNADFSFPERTG